MKTYLYLGEIRERFADVDISLVASRKELGKKYKKYHLRQRKKVGEQITPKKCKRPSDADLGCRCDGRVNRCVDVREAGKILAIDMLRQ